MSKEIKHHGSAIAHVNVESPGPAVVEVTTEMCLKFLISRGLCQKKER